MLSPVADTSATFADAQAGVGKLITVAGLSLSGPDASNYRLSATTTTTAAITPRLLTPVALGQNRLYDGTTNATVTLSDNALSGDAVTLAYASAAFASKQAGAEPITITGLSLSGADAIDYVLASTTTTATATITPVLLTVTAHATGRPYDGTTDATVSFLDNRVAGDLLTITSNPATFASKQVGVEPITVSGLSLVGADAVDYQLASTTLTTSATITPEKLTVTATGTTRPYDGTTDAASVVSFGDNREAGDVFTVSAATATFSDKQAGTGKLVTVSGLSLSGADAIDYVLASTTASTTATITPIQLTATAQANGRPYDGTTTTQPGEVTFTDNRLAGDVFNVLDTAETFASKQAGAESIAISGLSLQGADAIDYVLASTTTTATATITPIQLTATAQANDRPYDGATDTQGDNVTVTAPFDPGDAVTVAYTTATFANKQAGTSKVITITGLSLQGADAIDYQLSHTTVTATADITPIQLTATATAKHRTYEGTTETQADK